MITVCDKLIFYNLVLVTRQSTDFKLCMVLLVALSIGMMILRFKVAGIAWLVLISFQPIWESNSRARNLKAYQGIK